MGRLVKGPEPTAEVLKNLAPYQIFVEAERLGLLEAGDYEQWISEHPQFVADGVGENFYKGILDHQGSVITQAKRLHTILTAVQAAVAHSST